MMRVNCPGVRYNIDARSVDAARGDETIKYKPAEITEFSDTALQIIWDDGHESIYLYEDLRQECPCATCRQLRKTSKNGKLPFKKTIPLRVQSSSIKPLSIEPVGQYAFRFSWNDKHDTGIYTYEFLRELCSCEECRSGD
ncbi:MAG TPA: gamma-butyrobetaine hydroxylase-like domain-containing protein [Thermodesulfobacteriota bacterium]|nr:gamma-butyrobetaine hydroxylase-like domain-containing protein [Thermodesulfobacteriota bacterium]